MKLTVRLVMAFLAVALFATLVNALLSYRATQGNVERFFRDERVWQDSPRDNRHMGPPPLLEQRRLLARLQASQLEAGLWTLVVALAVGGYLAYRSVGPIRNLTQTARRYGQGERAQRAQVQGHDELAELALTFNQLVDQLQAEEAQQKRLVADIAHELRTPLTILRGELEAVRYGLMEPTPHNLDRLIEQVELLSRLVHDLRLLSLADSGGLSLHRTSFDLAELGSEVSTAFRGRSPDHLWLLEATPTPLYADRERLTQVLYNLLDNALRHTPAGGSILLRIENQTDQVRLEVRDSGPGVPAEHLPHLFERFYRADAARGREAGGSGLGLAIVQTLVQAHGGTAGVFNQETGGACFWIELPKERQPTE